MKITLPLGVLAIVSATYAQPAAPIETTTFGARTAAPVRIELDEIDVPRIEADSHADAIYALGYLHGRERFFQMDLSRRNAAGTLSELAGEATLNQDADMRLWNFTALATRITERLSDGERAIFERYTNGVNDGLASLPSAPPEYMLTGAPPEPWTVEACVLTTFTLVDQLSHSRWDERWNDAAHRTFSEPVFEFLHPKGGRLDAPIVGGAVPEVPMPTAEQLDLREALAGWPAESDQQSRLDPRDMMQQRGIEFVTRGSNNWAIGAGRAVGESAMLATDPHLGIQLPNVWYRAHIAWREEGEERFAVGITLPGLPVVIMGSNGDLAWGMTNVHGDFEDSVVVPEGYAFTQRTEEIRVRGRDEPVVRTYRDTEWGPVVNDSDHYGRTIASKWTGATVEGNTFPVLDLPMARTLEQALDIAASWKSAPQNVVIASKDGRTAWTLSGYLPNRIGFDGTVPVEWKQGEVGWEGEIPLSQRPRVIRDRDGFVFTANNRVGTVEQMAPIGTWFPDGSRAHRIREVLSQKNLKTEADLLALQLDTRTRRYDAWRDVVLNAIPEDETDPLLKNARAAAERWSGHADIDDTAHIFVRSIGWAMTSRVLEPFGVLARRTDPGASRSSRYADDVALRLVQERPAHLLSPRYESWDALIRDALRDLVQGIEGDYEEGMKTAWGVSNIARIEHPLAGLVGSMLPGLKAPADPLPGDWPAVRVAGPSFGASVRIVVSPGHEERGLCHMPGGQAGNPLDPDFLSGHAAWVEGRPTPLLPGPAVEIIELVPAP